MNWADLQVLLAFAREGTLQKAAVRLDVDISTVSRRIRSLERDLGAKVVENISGRLVLTAAGERAMEVAAAMAVETDNLQRAMQGEDTHLTGILRVALLDLFVLFHADLLSAFVSQYPHITLELVAATTQYHNLTRREADVAIRVAKQPDETLVGMRALHIEYAVYAHRTIAATPSIAWDKLPWIGWDPIANARMTDAWMAKHVPREQIRFRTDSPVAQFVMAEAGSGACLLPTVYADRSRQLVRLSDVLVGFDTDLWLLTHRDLQHNARVRAFFDFIYNGLEPLRHDRSCQGAFVQTRSDRT